MADANNKKNYDKMVGFHLPTIIRNTMEDTDASLQEYGELGPYLNWVETLDYVCKECYVTHAITHEQWDKIMSFYPL